MLILFPNFDDCQGLFFTQKDWVQNFLFGCPLLALNYDAVMIKQQKETNGLLYFGFKILTVPKKRTVKTINQSKDQRFLIRSQVLSSNFKYKTGMFWTEKTVYQDIKELHTGTSELK